MMAALDAAEAILMQAIKFLRFLVAINGGIESAAATP